VSAHAALQAALDGCQDLDDWARDELRERYLEQLRILGGGAIAPLEPGESLDLAGVAAVLMDLERRMAHLARVAAQLRACPEGDGIMAAKKCDDAIALLRLEFRQGAELLGVTVGMKAAEIRKLAATLQAETRAADE
jgi:hypothetical protein